MLDKLKFSVSDEGKAAKDLEDFADERIRQVGEKVTEWADKQK